MALKYTKGASTPALPIGKYPAKINTVAAIGTHPDPFNPGKMKSELYVEFSAVDIGTGEVARLMRTFTLSFYEKSKLSDLIDTVTDDDFEGKGLDELLGLDCQIKVEHTDKGRARISKWFPPNGETDLDVELIYFDFDPVNEEALGKLPDWVQKKVQESPEWAKYQESTESGADLDAALDDFGDLA